MVNNGQSCIAAKRFIVEAPVSREFLKEFTGALSEMKIGDPTLDQTEIGPLVNEKSFNDLYDQYNRAKSEGAEVILEPKLDREQNLFSPAVLRVPNSKVNKGVFAEEFFGPVALYFEVENLDEAIRLANDSSFGLGSNFWSQSETEIKRAINEIDAGMTFINSMVASEAQLPFGGVKNSGYGRELGTLGPHEFVNFKSVSISNSVSQPTSKAVD
jgi:succinate-semialdehyde dehydrogenase/glutarate-semialdehyde dehydrogenase